MRNTVSGAGKICVQINGGGFDSLLTAAILKQRGWKVHHLFIDYGHLAAYEERRAAMNIALLYGATFITTRLELGFLSGHGMLNPEVGMGAEKYADGTWDVTPAIVPVRNLMFLSVAASYAEQRGLKHIAVGFDGDLPYGESPVPDANKEMLDCFLKTLQVSSYGSAKRLQVIAPLLGKDKGRNIQRAKRMGVDLSLFYACYAGGAEPCGRCAKCLDYVKYLGDAYLQMAKDRL